MEVNLVAHILFTILCTAILFFAGFYCLQKKELVFFAVIVMAVKSALIFAIFQFPGLFNSGFFVDSKAYFQATSKTAAFFLNGFSLPDMATYELWNTDVSYVYAVINAFVYLLFPSASTGFLLNSFLYLLALLLFYRGFFDYGNSKFKSILFLTLLFWPSLFFNSLLFIRDGLIVLLIVTFLLAFRKKQSLITVLLMAICLLLAAAIRWYIGLSLVAFVLGNVLFSVYRTSKLAFAILSAVASAFVIALILYLGFTPVTIQAFRNLLTGLEGDYNANSVYLQSFIIDNYFKLFLFIPLSVFEFLFSPLLPLDANPLSLLACVENLLLLVMTFYALQPAKEKAVIRSQSLYDAFLFSVPLLLVYAFGVADSGTAIRQKGFLIFILVFAFFKKLDGKKLDQASHRA